MNTYGARHSDKCTKEEAHAFKKKVQSFLIGEKIPYKKLVALTSFGGQVKIFSGGTMHKMRLRMGRKLVAFKNPDGRVEGESVEFCEELLKRGGDILYIKTNEPIPEKEYHPVYLQDSWKEERDSILEWGKTNREQTESETTGTS